MEKATQKTIAVPIWFAVLVLCGFASLATYEVVGKGADQSANQIPDLAKWDGGRILGEGSNFRVYLDGSKVFSGHIEKLNSRRQSRRDQARDYLYEVFENRKDANGKTPKDLVEAIENDIRNQISQAQSERDWDLVYLLGSQLGFLKKSNYEAVLSLHRGWSDPTNEKKGRPGLASEDR